MIKKCGPSVSEEARAAISAELREELVRPHTSDTIAPHIDVDRLVEFCTEMFVDMAVLRGRICDLEDGK